MAKAKFYYFDTKGLGFRQRIALTLAGIDFEDVRLGGDEFASVKEKAPFGQLPFLEVEGTSICQSHAILIYAGMKGNMMYNDPLKDSRIYEVIAACDDLQQQVLPLLIEEDPEKREKIRQKLFEETLPPYFASFEKLTTKNGHRGFSVGDKLTVADLCIFEVVDYIKSGELDNIPVDFLESLPSFVAVYENVLKRPEVQACIKKEQH